jgi:ABC-type phosphate/phosphonate transport system substrate-binding protein
MIRLAMLAAFALSAAPTKASAPTPALRIASLQERSAPCGPLARTATPGEQAYFRLLAQRLEMPVLSCPVTSRADAARAVASGSADLAVLDADAYRPIAAKARSILTLRSEGEFTRQAIVVATRAQDARRSLAELRGASVVFGGSNRSYYERPLRALADQGVGDGYFGAHAKAASAEAALEMLRDGKVDAMALHAGAWRQVCLKVRGKSRCDELREVWRGRPRARLALVAPNTMSLETRYRLVGIHIAMHHEAPEAFRWASAWAPDAAEFEPTESEALILTSSQGPE